MSNFHRSTFKMAWLPLCQIANKSTETENNCFKFKLRVALAVELNILT